MTAKTQDTGKERRPVDIVRDIMLGFAESTGITGAGRRPRRYLWTDAFAVCNFLELWRQTGEERYRDLAVRLVEQVHAVLGRHREDDTRKGCISGLDEEEGKRHPTKGGLRIGKKLNERRAGEPFDDRMEWDRDGQYYHYLTKWMHALCQVGSATKDATYVRWAVELAKAAHAAFAYETAPGQEKRMYWKMSIDLSYPLVPSMGHHDPLDGWLTYCQLQAAVKGRGEAQFDPSLDLKEEIAEMEKMCEGKDWATDDPLGTGGLLSDAFRAAQLAVHGESGPGGMLAVLLECALRATTYCEKSNMMTMAPEYRLAFRELGLSIGLRAVERLDRWVKEQETLFDRQAPVFAAIDAFKRYGPWAGMIEDFWLEPAHRRSATWRDHLDINQVMLATSLAPDGYLTI